MALHELITHHYTNVTIRRLCKKLKFKAHESRRSERGMPCNAEVEFFTKPPKE
jgi:hypothetical protein